MFPFDLDDDEVTPTIEETKEPADYEIDFSTGKLTGKIIKGLDAIKQWVRLTLATDRYYFTQYSWDHGSELSSLIGQNYDKDFIDSEVKRMITDALSQNEYITDVTDIECTMKSDTLTVSLVIETIYGREKINV